jgi:hypothetical protein
VITSAAASGEDSFRLRRLGPNLAFLLFGALSAFHPTLFSAFRVMQTDLGDTRLNNFALEHGYRWLLGWITLHPISLWDQPIFFPAPNTGAYTEILLGSAPLYWSFRAFQFAPDTAFQLWMISVVVLDFVSMDLFLRNCLGIGPFASATGAFLFAFGSPRIAQLGHQQMLPQFFTMFALYGLFRWFRPARMTSVQGIFVFFACLAAQLWASFYLGWFLGLALIVLCACAACLPGRRKVLFECVATYRKPVALAAMLSLVVVAPMVIHYASARRATGPRPWWDAARMVPPLQSWLYLGPQSWLYSWEPKLEIFRRIATEHEQRLGIGWITLVLAIGGLYLLKRSEIGWWRVVWFSTIALLALVTLYPGGFTPWKLLFHVLPGGNAIRGVSRVAFVFLIPLSVGLAWLIGTRTRSAAVLLIAAICIVEQGQAAGGYDKLQARSDVSALAARVGKDCGAFYYSPVFSDSRGAPPQFKLHLDAMWAALLTGVPTVNGYSGRDPRGWWDLWDNRLFDEQSEVRMHESLIRWSALHQLDIASICWIDSR